MSLSKKLKQVVLKDKETNKKGLIEGVDSPYQWKKASKAYSKWEPEWRIGVRRKYEDNR